MVSIIIAKNQKPKVGAFYRKHVKFVHYHKFVLSEDTANEVVDYLEDDKYLAFQFVSPTIDPYDKRDQVPHIICTDGIYVWDGIIIHWVRKYRVRLPDEFLLHIQKVKSNPLPKETLNELPLLELMKTGEHVFS